MNPWPGPCARRGECGFRRAPLPAWPAARAPRAYTLFELVLVLALLVMLAVIAWPSLEAMYSDMRLAAAVDMVRARWAEARARSMEEGRPYRFSWVDNLGNFRVAPQGADYWQGAGLIGEAPAPADGSSPPLVADEALPKGVCFCDPEVAQATLVEAGAETALPAGSVDSGMWGGTIIFLPDGTIQDDVEVALAAHAARPVVLRLRALTGVVTVIQLQTGAR